MENPILVLGNRPLTFEAPPCTFRAGWEERTRTMAVSVAGEMWLRWHQMRNSSSVSMASFPLFVENPLMKGFLWNSLQAEYTQDSAKKQASAPYLFVFAEYLFARERC